MMNFAKNEKFITLKKNTTMRSETPISWGGYPPGYPLGGGLTITRFLHDEIQYK